MSDNPRPLRRGYRPTGRLPENAQPPSGGGGVVDPETARMRELIEKSSLGTPEAKALRDTVSDEQVAKVTNGAAEISLAKAGPGGQCAECGHFAMRHWTNGCNFPRPEDNPCTCKGMLWECERVDMKKVIDIATGTYHE